MIGLSKHIINLIVDGSLVKRVWSALPRPLGSSLEPNFRGVVTSGNMAITTARLSPLVPVLRSTNGVDWDEVTIASMQHDFFACVDVNTLNGHIAVSSFDENHSILRIMTSSDGFETHSDRATISNAAPRSLAQTQDGNIIVSYSHPFIVKAGIYNVNPNTWAFTEVNSTTASDDYWVLQHTFGNVLLGYHRRNTGSTTEASLDGGATFSLVSPQTESGYSAGDGAFGVGDSNVALVYINDLDTNDRKVYISTDGFNYTEAWHPNLTDYRCYIPSWVNGKWRGFLRDMSGNEEHKEYVANTDFSVVDIIDTEVADGIFGSMVEIGDNMVIANWGGYAAVSPTKL